MEAANKHENYLLNRLFVLLRRRRSLLQTNRASLIALGAWVVNPIALAVEFILAFVFACAFYNHNYILLFIGGIFHFGNNHYRLASFDDFHALLQSYIEL